MFKFSAVRVAFVFGMTFRSFKSRHFSVKSLFSSAMENKLLQSLSLCWLPFRISSSSRILWFAAAFGTPPHANGSLNLKTLQFHEFCCFSFWIFLFYAQLVPFPSTENPATFSPVFSHFSTANENVFCNFKIIHFWCTDLFLPSSFFDKFFSFQ
mgnify:CR=1 FL=1